MAGPHLSILPTTCPPPEGKAGSNSGSKHIPGRDRHETRRVPGVLRRRAKKRRDRPFSLLRLRADIRCNAVLCGRNTYLYPTGQHLFASVQDAITKAAGCGSSEAGTPCLGPLAPTSTIEKINTDYSTHLLEYYQDKSAADREFHVPFIGIAPDRGWFWLINIVSSLLLYVMLRGSLENHLHLLEYLFNETKGNTAQVILRTTTQIMTSASRSRESEHRRATCCSRRSISLPSRCC